MKITLTDPVLRFSQNTRSPCVSICYSTHRGGPETRQDPIRLRNLLRDARERLCELGHEAEADAILQKGYDLIPDLDFWRHLQEGLALFMSPNEFRYFHLPYPVPEFASVANHFHLRPILPLFSGRDQFYILTLSKHQVRLYEANRYSIRHVEVPELPESMAEALQFDEGEQQLQRRSFGPAAGVRTGAMRHQGVPFYQGQGGEKDTHVDELLRYFRTVDRGLRRHLNGSQEPLILAGVDHYFSIYHRANTYSNLLEEGIPGGVESFSEKELHEKAWPVVRPHLNLDQKRVIERFERIAYNDGEAAKNAARELETAVVAAFEGRVDALILPREPEVWGEFNEDTMEVKRESNDPAKQCELLNFAAMQTVLHGGEVFVVPQENMPPDAEVAALLRYSGGLLERAS